MVAAQPNQSEPDRELDRAVWRILSCAQAAGVEVSDDQLRATLNTFSRDRLAGIVEARMRVVDMLAADAEPGSPDEPWTTLDEAIDAGLLGVACEDGPSACPIAGRNRR